MMSNTMEKVRFKVTVKVVMNVTWKYLQGWRRCQEPLSPWSATHHGGTPRCRQTRREAPEQDEDDMTILWCYWELSIWLYEIWWYWELSVGWYDNMMRKWNYSKCWPAIWGPSSHSGSGLPPSTFDAHTTRAPQSPPVCFTAVIKHLHFLTCKHLLLCHSYLQLMSPQCQPAQIPASSGFCRELRESGGMPATSESGYAFAHSLSC